MFDNTIKHMRRWTHGAILFKEVQKMNKIMLIGRLTKDPEVRYSAGDRQMAIAKYTLAVDRRGKDKEADFIPCTAFDKTAEFAEKYLRKGMKIAIAGKVQTGSFKDKEGKTQYTWTVVVEDHEFCESKTGETATEKKDEKPNDGFMEIPQGGSLFDL